MGFGRLSFLMRSLAAVGGSFFLGLLLSGTISPDQAQKRLPHEFRGQGCLPLSGDLSAAGDAFRQGFMGELAEAPDSQFTWRWQWTDNGSDPDLSQKWFDTLTKSPQTDLLLAGLGPAMDGFDPRLGDSIPCLLLGDGPVRSRNSWAIWPTTEQMRTRLLAILRQAPEPIAIILVASGSWSEVVLGGLNDSLPDLLVLPHDLDNSRWDDEIKALYQTRPGTILFWDRPHEASSLLSKRLGWSLFRQAKLIVPEGTVLPDSVTATILAPVWQPSSPPDSLQCARYFAWGRHVGRNLVQASRRVVCDSVKNLATAFPLIERDSLGSQTASQGWLPLADPAISRLSQALPKH